MSRLKVALEAGMIPGDIGAFTHYGDRKIKLYDGGGSSPAPAPASQTVTQTSIPEYAQPYATEMFGKAQALTDINQNPYQTYGAQRTAGFNPLQTQAYQNVQQMQASPAIGAGMDVAANVANQAGQYQGYNPLQAQQLYQAPEFQSLGLEYLMAQAPQLQQYQMGPTPMARAAQTGAAAPVSGPQLQQYAMGPAQDVIAAQTRAARDIYGPQLQQYAMGPAERAMTGSFAQPGSAEAYMSPYMQNVVDVQQREAQRQADIAKTQRGARAASSGAFGGSRQAIEEAEAARNLATQKGDIQAAGLQSAFQQAQQAYQTDAARQLQAQLANQQAGLTVGQQNLASALQTQGLGAQTGMQAQLANQQAQQQALMANQQARQQAALANQQAGLTVGQQNLAAALQTQGLGAQTGLQAALANQQAQQQALMANQQARQQVGLANQQAGLTTQQQNLAALLQTQGLGAQTGMQAQQLNQAAQLQAQQQALGQSQAANQFAQQNAQLAAQYGLSGLQAAEQSRQFGAGLGLQGLQQQLAAAGQLGQLGQQNYQQLMGINQAQQQAGAQIQALEQQGLTQRYQDFLNQQRYPYQQLAYMSDILRGVPATSSAQTIYQAPATPVNQLASLGLGAYGVGQLFGAGKKKGGVIKKYKKGGAVKASGAGLGELAIHVAMGGE